jgi:hypothetical protein
MGWQVLWKSLSFGIGGEFLPIVCSLGDTNVRRSVPVECIPPLRHIKLSFTFLKNCHQFITSVSILKYVQTSVVWASLEPLDCGTVVGVLPWFCWELIMRQSRGRNLSRAGFKSVNGRVFNLPDGRERHKREEMSSDAGHHFPLIKGIVWEENTADLSVRRLSYFHEYGIRFLSSQISTKIFVV